MTSESTHDGLIDGVVARAASRRDEDRKAVETFLRLYYSRADPDDLIERSVEDLYGAALSHLKIARDRQPGTAAVRVYTPDHEQHGWRSTHTAIDIVVDDMPFLVDSVTMELNRHGLRSHLVLYPVIGVERGDDGRLREVARPEGIADDSGSMRAEAFLHFEVDRQPADRGLDTLREDIARVLGDVRHAVEDWRPMRARADELADELAARPPPIHPEELAEARALLTWMIDGSFTFLGCRAYDLVQEGDTSRLRAATDESGDDTGLGVLREGAHESRSFGRLPQWARERARHPDLLVVTKASARATVHRPAYLDFVGVRRFDVDGQVVGEHRFLGLFTSAAYSSSVFDVPVARQRARAVLERSGLPPSGHAGKALAEILESYPRDEVFQTDVDELHASAMGILHLQERQRVRLFVRADPFERFVSCLVFLPRDRYTTITRGKITDVLLDAFAGTLVSYTPRLTESVLARLHLIVRTQPGAVPDHDVDDIESRLLAAVRSWSDDLPDALVEEVGETEGIRLLNAYGDSFPVAYREDFPARAAVADIRRLDTLTGRDDLAMSLYRPLDAETGFLRLKLYTSGRRISLSDVLPQLEHMGVTVVDERPYEIERSDGPEAWIYDFGLQCEHGQALDAGDVREQFQEALARVLRGDAESDGFNRLVLAAGLTWHQVAALRAYSAYLRQAGTAFSQQYMEATLVAHADAARLLIELFEARFDPERDDDDRSAAVTRHADALIERIDAVQSLDEDRILRGFFDLVQATLRTNFFQRDESGNGRSGGDGPGPKRYVSFKLDPSQLRDLPKPAPMFEIFVHSPRVEGVHLRGGAVARGGLRWSDRREDYRTEVLGLMKAQMVKNAVIVPAGAKGGFVVKRLPPGSERDAQAAEVTACYRTFISGLLDVTDNRVGDAVVPPSDMVRYDDDDPYLVVAADKGTARLSDVANDVARAYGFWLDDAFASGGSAGYDHKRMGITARGAWESVKRHFRDLGMDPEERAFTVVGIGDMSGDVFGNGMLLSRHTRLVGGFDHQHVFLDPDPDPEASFAERERLFGLARSSWDDYDRDVLSAGGGVYARTAKTVPISPEAQAALGVDVDALTPDEVVRAILRAPVDLLWNGGIGTFVKASAERHADVGDKTNDGVRVDATELRCRVVAEGGNLGLTQRARIEYALAGGRVFTDAIDNSAGVDCSDHEVNIKILLDQVVADGDLTEKQRNALLVKMTDAVAAQVLRDNASHALALANARAQAFSMAEVHGRYIHTLDEAGYLDRALESLPSVDELAERRARETGLTAPESAVVLAYTKIALDTELLASDLPEDPYFEATLAGYFPQVLRERFERRLQSHPLRREIIATTVTNTLVDTAGTSFLYRFLEETRAPIPEIVRAHIAASAIMDTDELRTRVAALGPDVEAGTQVAMLLAIRRSVERATRWLLQRCRAIDIGAVVESFAPGFAALRAHLSDLLVGGDRSVLERATDDLVAAGAPPELALEVASLNPLFAGFDIVDISRHGNHAVEEVAAVSFRLGERLRVDWLRDQIVALPRDDRWATMARAALRADLYAQHRTLTAEVLAHSEAGERSDATGGPGRRADAAVSRFLAHHQDGVHRYRQVVTDVSSGTDPTLASLTVAVRHLCDLAIESSAPESSGPDPGPTG